MTYILHIESATKVCSVALSKNGQLISFKENQEDGYSHGENLTLFIEELLEKENIHPNQLSAISVASGPGSYTGLRIGVSCAKGLCYALSIPLIAIDALTSLKELAKDKYPNINLCPLIDARRMEVYASFFNPQNELIKPISADILDENSYSEFEPFVYFGDGAEKLKDIWVNKNCQADLDIISSAKGLIDLAYKKFLNSEFENVAYFEPFYLKDFIVGVTKKQ
ncbi:MAG: tRNA (adenosine(37)-N6)-threonylcarbamoyltransferase complex dimerization subunit type 1 TsaB [Flavobacteriia bacterium]|nr:tRNA (adenosine(37)-N6)-threonylcarbamoyltransferase complex dimerization subunit type 1 TsaB [Flavobacteriia bacterium]